MGALDCLHDVTIYVFRYVYMYGMAYIYGLFVFMCDTYVRMVCKTVCKVYIWNLPIYVDMYVCMYVCMYACMKYISAENDISHLQIKAWNSGWTPQIWNTLQINVWPTWMKCSVFALFCVVPWVRTKTTWLSSVLINIQSISVVSGYFKFMYWTFIITELVSFVTDFLMSFSWSWWKNRFFSGASRRFLIAFNRYDSVKIVPKMLFWIKPSQSRK